MRNRLKSDERPRSKHNDRQDLICRRTLRGERGHKPAQPSAVYRHSDKASGDTAKQQYSANDLYHNGKAFARYANQTCKRKDRYRQQDLAHIYGITGDTVRESKAEYIAE